MDLFTAAKEQHVSLRNRKGWIEGELKKTPAGRIAIQKRGDSYRWYVYKDQKRQYLPKKSKQFVCCGRDSVGCLEVIFRLRPTSYYIVAGYFGHLAFLSCFEIFVPFQEENSEGIPGCGRADWAFLEEFLIFVPFCSFFATPNWQEKGTKIRKWQENAQMAEKKGRKTEVFLPSRGTNF